MVQAFCFLMQKHDVTATATLFSKLFFQILDTMEALLVNTPAAVKQRWNGLHMQFQVSPKTPFEKAIMTLME